MGFCESNERPTDKTGSTQGNIQKEQLEQITRNAPINIPEKRVEDAIAKYFSKPFIEYPPNVSKILSNLICRISIETQGKEIIGSGFILGFLIDLENFDCLMTTAHVISNESINNNNILHLIFEESKQIDIKLDRNKRYNKSFTDKELDITVVELLDEDNVRKNFFLEPELDIPINEKLINNEIDIPQYIIEEKKLMNAEGIIKNISKYELSYSANTVKGSSGNPIFLKNSNKVIGIHKSRLKNQKNFGNLISPVIDLIKEDIRKKRNNGKYTNGKYIYDDGKYYIGEFQNNTPNGYGIKYNKNGNILYEGSFINGKFEGNGKYIREDGTIYIGQWKNGLCNGKGTMYYPNGNIKYEGDWVDNKYEGYGKQIWKNGEYYIGQFKNGLSNGKGTEYYPNGNIIYEGDWFNGKSEGYGKFFWKDGYYYIGQFKNDKRNGKGIMYFPNGDIEYEGDWVNDKYEGNGKYFLEDGNCYIGHFRDGKMNGKGIMYYPNGKIMREGNWINGTWFRDIYKILKYKDIK